MNIINIMPLPWAIAPEYLMSMSEIVTAHLRGPKLNLKDIETRILTMDDMPGRRDYSVENGVAIIPISGPISKNPDIFDRVFFGMTSSSSIMNDILKAIADPQVSEIILTIDSPGGTVDGTQELARVIYESREEKPITAFSDGLIASAAYWIGSAANKIFISGDTVGVGSIGVIATHIDYSEMEKQDGVKITEIFAGKYKNALSKHFPLSETGLSYIQDRIDYLYSVFINDISGFRGISHEKALSMADGKVYVGKNAIDAGLVDGVSTLDALINKKSPLSVNNVPGAGALATFTEMKLTGKEVNMPIPTIESLEKEAPEVYGALIAKGKAEAANETEEKIKAAEEKGRQEGRTAEIERIIAVKEQGLPGHEKLIEEMMFDGKTTAGEAAIAINKAEKEKRAGALSNLQGDLKNSAGFAIPPEARDPVKDRQDGEEFMKKVSEYVKENKCSKGDAISAIAKSYPNLHDAYIKSINKVEE